MTDFAEGSPKARRLFSLVIWAHIGRDLGGRLLKSTCSGYRVGVTPQGAQRWLLLC